jgi:hypothetical protein
MPSRLPRWLRVLASLILLAQVALLPLLFVGPWQGPVRNILVQLIAGGFAALLVLGAHAIRYHGEAVREWPARLGLLLLTALALLLVGVYAYSVSPILAMPYDLGSWSEPMFVVDIIKLRTGTPLYLPPGDSNSNTYTFGTPVLSYFLAWLFGQSSSIIFYRWILQAYLALAALFAGWSAWRLVGLASADHGIAVSRWWIPFFVLASFLFAVNPATGVFLIYLHNDPLAILATAVGFWLLVQYAATGNQRWLWAMALMPTVGFLVKQYLLILLVCYLTHLVLAGRDSLRRVVIFGAVSAGIFAATVSLCYVLWGQSFVYWVVQVMGGHTISLARVLVQFGNAAVFLLPGVVGGWYLLHRSIEPRFLGLWTGWMVMVLGAAYTSGITFHPSHYGPAVMVGACFFLASLARAWPKADHSEEVPGRALLQSALGFLAVLMLFGSFRLMYPERKPLSSDLFRYATEIEAEFDGLPADSVLLDLGEWVYLQRGVVMTDRNAIFLTHRTMHDDLKRRVREQRFSRILVHSHGPDLYSYDAGKIHKGIREEMLRSYREVRRIPAVRGMESWLYHSMMLSEISVLEPISPPGMQTPASGNSRRREEP